MLKESTKNQSLIWGALAIAVFAVTRLNLSQGIDVTDLLTNKIPELSALGASIYALFRGSKNLLHQDPPVQAAGPNADADQRSAFNGRLHWLIEYARSQGDTEMVGALMTAYTRFAQIPSNPNATK